MALTDPLVFGRRRRIIDLATKHRLPGMFEVRAFVLVDRILKGVKPADLPVEQPTKFELVVSRRTPRVLSLAVPASLLLRADEMVP